MEILGYIRGNSTLDKRREPLVQSIRGKKQFGEKLNPGNNP
jgi:hypothetical protein